MNRQLARIVGDWSFPLGLNGWKKKWSLTHCKTLDKHCLIHDDCDDFLPKEINFNKIKGLSNESIDILNQHKPETIRQASLLPGFTSSAVFLLLYHIKNKKTKLA